ncbi:hypothetical protein [uncultured Thiodictyon sp.]|uniref:hypothetical protein n=1 Tax=uncultured Thiodictyon sp. TaxID=1846217 RepID=UPI0025D9D3D5|nr:hypothetical protein [uncultured Thiodictyon sp.]
MSRSSLAYIGFAAAINLTAVFATEAQQQTASENNVVGEIQRIASESKCITHHWNAHGLAPRPYIKGMGLVYARALCNRNADDVQLASAPVDSSRVKKDALAAYQQEFKDAGMQNDTPVDILRHNYALLIGLGMRESSGKYCEGRDVSQCFTTPESAEAGLFQTSYGAHTAILAFLKKQYADNKRSCLKEEFGGSAITCRIQKSHNPRCSEATSDIVGVVGKDPGADWQKMTKECPAFAAEYAAVVLRKNGGAKGEFGPVRRHEAELLQECDTMLKNIQGFVESHPEACSAL